MEDTPYISVLMPVRNEAAFISRSLGAVLAQDYPRNRMEVIVADGMSDDGTREIIETTRQHNSNVILIDNPGRIVSTGLNAALRVAKGEIIVRVDGHCEIAADYVRRCVSHLLESQVDCVGGQLETVGETYTARVIAAAMSSRFGVGGSAFRVGVKEARFTDTLAFPAYSRETIKRVGYFDEELVRNQDDEYNYRLRKLGGRVLLTPDIRSRYYSRATIRKLWKQYFQYGYWKVRVLQKHPGQMQLRQFVPLLFVVTLLSGLLLMPVSPAARYFTGLITSLYTMVVIISSILCARASRWQLFPLLPITFATLHSAYGLGFLYGLIKFWNRWGEDRGRAQVASAIPDLDKYESI